MKSIDSEILRVRMIISTTSSPYLKKDLQKYLKKLYRIKKLKGKGLI